MKLALIALTAVFFVPALSAQTTEGVKGLNNPNFSATVGVYTGTANALSAGLNMNTGRHRFSMNGLLIPNLSNPVNQMLNYGGNFDYQIRIGNQERRIGFLLCSSLLFTHRNSIYAYYDTDNIMTQRTTTTIDKLALNLGFGIELKMTQRLKLTASVSNSVSDFSGTKNFREYFGSQPDDFGFNSNLNVLTPLDFIKGKSLISRIGISIALGKSE